ncbi:TolC family protein [Paraburkholderia acidiphila]|uniref:TolC family protein n=1 Tax=Paraburkholderia acidiphila TaxID=2571747 RepID=A0A7Z2J8I8_9BURK|nr:TolC family protein [Paraburkholderia acidiphila]QGZ54668.1 TolC family protein [Paraburkholderia acidiphila]
MPSPQSRATLPRVFRLSIPAGTRAALVILTSGTALLAGCASYVAQPLATGPSLIKQESLARVRIDPAKMPLPELAAHRFDPSDGFDIEDVAMLAVANNPDLKLARDDLGITQAQAFSTGLLPDPQVSVSSDYPGAVGLSRAFSYGLSMDVMAIVTRGANTKSANATVRKTDLGLLWQEWQVVAQAKQLYVRARFQDEVLPLLEQQTALARTRYERTARAASEHNVTADSVTASLTAYEDARKQNTDMQRAREQTHHDLNALLGLAPDTTLVLAGDTTIAPMPDGTLDAAIALLPQRRPDLIALQAGYEAQEQKYRAAILGQFPSLSVGFTRQRDTSEIYTSGFAINLTLPVFNRNRGNIAIEQATRQRLADEYQTRLNAAYADVAHLRADSAIAAQQLEQDAAALPRLERAAAQAADAYAARNILLGQYVDAQSAALARRIDAATAREALAEQRIGLQALLGGAIPDPYQTSPARGAAAESASSNTNVAR